MNRFHIAVLGFGSVGSRHARNALALGCDVTLVRSARRGNDLGLPEVDSVRQVEPDAFIVATPTAYHADAMLELGSRREVMVLCEKPLCATRRQAELLSEAAARQGDRWRVALQLRYHPLFERLESWVVAGDLGRLLYLTFSVGQYLPDWRPSRDHRATYSATVAEGGGVLLDLVHEFDLARRLSGDWSPGATGISRRVGAVTNDADDVAEITWQATSGAVVHVHVDYLYPGLLREAIVVGDHGAARLDLAKGQLVKIDRGGAEDERIELQAVDRNSLFLRLLDEFIQGRDAPDHCRLPSASEHLRLQELLWPFMSARRPET